MHIPSEYSTDFDTQKTHQQLPNKLNGYGSNNYRASFSSYPNTNRPRHQNSQSVLNSGSFRDPHTFYPSSNDVYTSQMTSPIQSHMQPYDSRATFDFGSAGQSNLGGAHKPYLDPYGPSSGMLPQSHGNPNKPQQQQGQQHNVYSAGSGTLSNGMQFSSQTPYGPHVPTTAPSSAANPQSAGAQSGGPPGLAGSASMGMVNGAAGASNQEEISTIFVVGFPEDMQEREFQNMFTFSPGFEAATLKIPNKEYTAYGGIVGPSSRSYQTFTGPNDPYNLVTVNQGGVVVDGGRDGTMASWPAVPGDDGPGGPFMSGGVNMPPRKQIIGFAKFRSREEALGARDVLQGRRVDIEKGAVLKAEMAKKNLHTKRGVGPVPVSGPGGVGAAGGMVVGALGGLPPGILGAAGLGGAAGPSDPYSMGSDSSLTSRERELGALGAMGGLMSARPGSWRDQPMQQQEPTPMSANGVSVNHLNGVLTADEERRREREAGILNAMVLGAGRGPRERADEEERERRRKERLRATNTTAFDAFHSVPMQQAQGLNQAGSSSISRQLSTTNGSNINGAGSSLLPPSMENGGGSGLGSSPLMGNAFASAFSQPPQMQQPQSQLQQDEIVGPWDRLSKVSITNIAPGRPRSSSQRSTSPPNISSHGLGEAPRSFSPSLEQRFHAGEQQRQRQVQSESSASSVTGGSSVAGGNTTLGAEDGGDEEMSRAMDQLALNTNNGNTSPQLPSPASGASSASARNGVDQNPPINTLYVGNLPTSPPPMGFPQDYLEESLRDLFSTRPGFRRLCFRHKSNGPMCFVEFEDVHFATKALNDLYGHTLKGMIKGGGIRLSYSKNPLGVRTPTSAGSTAGPSLQQQQQMQSGVSQGLGFGSGFQSEASQQAPPTILRREGGNMPLASPPPIGGGQSYNNNFLSSPPPRFFSTSPGSTNQYSIQSSSTPLTSTSNAFVPRGNAGLYNYNIGATNGLSSTHSSSSTFSPFGLSSPPPHSSIPEGASSDALMSRALSPPSNIEVARAG
ncbi:hypothetical protein BDQ12DRAFT_695859 [Crucibulum laeve]|uniref:RRM domain-containing protein n=1 Tax=Crucibulum laeve TaxID=68775 RepID=A0A5C3MFX3_9AGAR|nr:hypothetical protein BDQ12DRAFT_695859 [Crucibulum laeve]